MGPWLNNAGGLFGFWPVSRDYSLRITRQPTSAATKVRHPGGMIGMMVNGVAIYDLGDAFSFNQTNGTAPSASNVTGSDAMGATGDGYWSRDALAVEVVTFDPGFAHQPGNNGQYHYHAEPKALRYQLGDNMKATYNAATNTYNYTEIDPTGVVTPLHHSPIIGWCYDGYPIYGPYGYSSPNNPTSSVTRMRSGFVLRNATNAATYGTANLSITGRVTLPRWAAIAQGYLTESGAPAGDYNLPALNGYGPLVSTAYSLGRYIGDYDYLGDRGRVQGVDFNLDKYNGRQCVTPEFPNGTYAYFVAIDASGNTTFPHLLGKQYYGTSNSTANVTIPAGATVLFNGGPKKKEQAAAPIVNPASGNVTLTWSSVEGGTYQVEASNSIATGWSTIGAAVPAAADANTTSLIDPGAARTSPQRFYRLSRTSTGTYDPVYTGQ
ncbi:MAG TPA: hypothetical protein DDW21_01845 [Verrucomicrobiales bacterium]|nr:hypothetical protein [Verrucomicrobiales bacterium]